MALLKVVFEIFRRDAAEVEQESLETASPVADRVGAARPSEMLACGLVQSAVGYPERRAQGGKQRLRLQLQIRLSRQQPACDFVMRTNREWPQRIESSEIVAIRTLSESLLALPQVLQSARGTANRIHR